MRTKKVKAILLSVVVVMIMSAGAFAQGRLSIGAELAMPMGDLGDAVSTGFGGSLRYEMPMGDNLGLTLTAGYLSFGGKEDGAPSWSMIPIQAGAKYYFNEQMGGFYAGVEVGVHSMSYETEDVVFMGTTIPGETYTSTDLSYAPGVGYHLANLDLGLRYQLISGEASTSSYLGLRIAYVLGGK